MKKVLFFLVMLFLLPAFGCSKKTEKIIVAPSLAGKKVLVGDIPCEFPLVKKKTTLNITSAASEDTKFDDVFVWQKYEQLTNVNIKWTTCNKDESAEKFEKMMQNKQQTDLIMRFKISGSDLLKYGKQDLLVDLAKNDLLKKYAPNCWNYLTTHPDTLASIMNPDGSIYALPQVNSGAELRVSRKIYINKNWLTKVNKEVPKTTEEFYEMLKAFKTQDANGNGKDDEIPFCPRDWASVIESFYGAFGLGNRGQHNMTVDYDEVNNKTRFIPASSNYKQFLEYFNKLYKEKLIPDNYDGMSKSVWYQYALEDKIGVFTHTNLGSLPPDKIDDWVAVEDALIGPNGDQLWAGIRANFHTTGNAIIPKTCTNIELVLKWLDYFWTDEGTLFYHMGIEGETFEEKDDGTYDYLTSIYDEMLEKDISFDACMANYSPYPGGGNPTVEIAPYFMGGEMAKIPASAAKKLFTNYGPTEYWPSFTFTTEEYDSLININKVLDLYTKTKRKEYISGQISFDTWNDYVKQIEEYDVDELLTIYSNAVIRYKDILKNNTK